MNSAVAGFDVQACPTPRLPGELDAHAPVAGLSPDPARQAAQVDPAVPRRELDVPLHSLDGDATVVGLQVQVRLPRHEQLVTHGPVHTLPTGRAPGDDALVGRDLDPVGERASLVLIHVPDQDLGPNQDVLPVLARDTDSATPRAIHREQVRGGQRDLPDLAPVGVPAGLSAGLGILDPLPGLGGDGPGQDGRGDCGGQDGRKRRAVHRIPPGTADVEGSSPP